MQPARNCTKVNMRTSLQDFCRKQLSPAVEKLDTELGLMQAMQQVKYLAQVKRSERDFLDTTQDKIRALDLQYFANHTSCTAIINSLRDIKSEIARTLQENSDITVGNFSHSTVDIIMDLISLLDKMILDLDASLHNNEETKFTDKESNVPSKFNSTSHSFPDILFSLIPPFLDRQSGSKNIAYTDRSGINKYKEGIQKLSFNKEINTVEVFISLLTTYPNVIELDFHDAMITDELLLSLCTDPALEKWRTQLKRLNIKSQCNLTNTSLEALGHLENLQNLIADNTKVEDRHLAPLVRLHHLSLAHCRRMKSFGCLAHLTQLQELNLQGTDIGSPEDVHALGHLHNLKNLNLHSCARIPNGYFGFLSNLTQLQELNLQRTKIGSPEDLLAFHSLNNLIKLDLNLCFNIPTGFFRSFVYLPQLQELNLQGTKIGSPEDLLDLGNLRNLQKLNLYGCSEIPNDCFGFLAHLTQLQELNLQRTKIGSPEDLLALGNLRNLQKLNLYGCIEIPANNFEFLLNFTQLQELDLQMAKIGLPEGLLALGNLHNLTNLNLYGCSEIPNDCFGFLAHLTQLQELNLQRTKIGSPEDLRALDKLRNLKKLDLYGCTKIPANNFEFLLNFTQLQELNLVSTSIIDSEESEALYTALHSFGCRILT